MKTFKRIIKSICLCAVLVTICLILITIFSGFRHEYKKFKQLLITFICITLMRFIILEHIGFVILSLIKTKISKKPENKKRKNKNLTEIFEADNGEETKELLKLRLQSLRAELNLSSRDKDETLNLEYQLLTQEFWLFGKYFLLVLILIVYSRNQYGYYNTATIKAILNNNYFANYSLEDINTIDKLYNWINDTLTGALNEGQDYNGSPIEEPGWMHFHLAKLLGVVRLQQIRHSHKTRGMLKLYFDEKDYLPEWKRLKRNLHYTEKYWRIYYPWLSKYYEGAANWLMSFTHIGSLYSYSENNGYVALLARDQKNSMKIIKFLKENKWLDNQTAAVFIDFTLYNIDSNIFTICSILVEQTPFGNLVWQLNVESAALLANINQMSLWQWFFVVLYILQLMKFCKIMILKAWFTKGFFKRPWNCVDFTIIVLNLILFIFIVLREYYVVDVIKLFAISKKLEYVDFRVASLFDYMASIIMGFLVCLTSLRLWKLLQFSSIFRIFNRTLCTSAGALFATIVGIHIFLFAIGLAAQIVNGSHTEIFSRYLKSVTAIMSFSFGFNSRTSPDDLSHGGGALGFILYLILMFVVAIFLINMFITLICDHFSNAREERDNQPGNRLTYWQFLQKEYNFITPFCNKFFPKYYERKNHTVAENIAKKLNELELKSQHQEFSENVDLTEEKLEEEEILTEERIKKISNVLELQMEILQRFIALESLEWESEVEESEGEKEQEQS